MEELNLASPSSNCTITETGHQESVTIPANLIYCQHGRKGSLLLVPRGMMGEILTNWTKKRIVARILPFSEPRFPYSGYRSTPTANAD
ncbi:hypothetical protein DTO164E3_473 [Paecilomyces variotii]|nr:hypothetical protein DTO032I3_1803 [Paecilomyces variotii]KAJ9207199.1 hypothetical protein DTO164E3_473 [Paecilomyces variotii]KAJ9240327.1 hypothetical protein DTO169E5_4115 [Paecilomyces variotii]KAJ9281035.1 hypothetical protein DTO021D3_2089 [Paecilomyces variotii]KAJ9345408.1 hypothetical protein DTO027B6_1939 [Paecilomyces variotii]